ncbi:hypothetical protein BJB45_17905 [Halomonas huangheensis]|uniref:Uncharacterized protein n=1 Tax=Halomonas huangheensis TaxID=1178482 RepID=W1ND11_9GAMM|nr:hypothetical protein BJB45_17905 [Halomonas huangheensis]
MTGGWFAQPPVMEVARTMSYFRFSIWLLAIALLTG